MKPLTITKTIFFKQPPEAVWPYLTQAKQLSQWFLTCDHDLAQGEPYELYQQDEDGHKKAIVWGKILTLTPPNKLIYTFLSADFKDTPSTVTIELTKAGQGTRLTLVHEGIAEALGDQALDYTLSLDHGWEQHFASLRDATRSE